MTFKDVVSYLLQSLEVGQVDEQNRIVQYNFHGTAATLSRSTLLLFRTAERGALWLIRREYFRFEQELSPEEIRLVYKVLRREVKRATLPPELGTDYLEEVRQEAVAMLDQVIGQHQYLRQLLERRQQA